MTEAGRSKTEPAGVSPRSLILVLLGVAAVALILIWWKVNQREGARQALEETYGVFFEADPNGKEGDWVVVLEHDSLNDLSEAGPLLARSGNITVLDLSGCERLETLDGVESISSLVALVAIACPSLTSIEAITAMPSLKEVVIQECPKLRNAGTLAGLPELETLDLSGGGMIESLPPIELANLAGLTLSNADRLKSLDLREVPSLERLYLEGCRSLASIHGMENAKRLTDLDLSGCHQLAQVDGIESLAELRMLTLKNTSAMGDLNLLGQMKSLEILRLGGQEELTDLSVLSAMENLTELHVEACENFASLEGLPESVSGYAAFTYCPSLISTRGIEAAQELQRVDLSGCESLTEIEALATLKKLQEVNLGDCKALTGIDPLAKLPELQIIQLGGSGVTPAAVKEIQRERPAVIFDFSGGGEF